MQQQQTLWRRLRKPVLLVGVFSAILNMLLLVPALFMLQVFDRVLTSRSGETLLVLLLGALVGLVMMFGLDMLRSRLQGIIAQLVGDSLLPEVARQQVTDLAAPNGRTGTSLLQDLGQIRQLLSTQGALALFDGPWLFIYVLVITLIHPLMGLAAAVSALLMIGLTILTYRLTRRDLEVLRREGQAVTRHLDDSLRSAEAIAALGMMPMVVSRWARLSMPLLEHQEQLASRSVVLAAASRTVRQGIQVLMLAVGAWLVVTDRGTPGIMIAATVLLGRVMAPIEVLVSSWRNLAEGWAAWRRLAPLLATDTTATPMVLPAPKGELRATGLGLRAPDGSRMLLNGIDFVVDAGQSCAIVGPSGAGKSTLARLALGIWRPTVGSVRIDGADVALWPRDQLGPWLGYVPQQVEFFAGSVAENIARLGSVDADAVVRAAKRAQVHEMILSLPQGYDTLAGSEQFHLSPGQRQRIALARALYGDPRVIVLDEPNSNLDGAGEAALGAVLRSLRGEVTVIVITHRITLVRDVDLILVLEGGRRKHFGPTRDVLRAMEQAHVSAAVAPLHREPAPDSSGGDGNLPPAEISP